MNNYSHCPRNYLLQRPVNKDQIKQKELCDFCWNEYCFCWSEYCLNEWYELQIKHNNLKNRHHTKDKINLTSLRASARGKKLRVVQKLTLINNLLKSNSTHLQTKVSPLFP
jgi:hypothetical protein